jgi:hypothetical protein
MVAGQRVDLHAIARSRAEEIGFSRWLRNEDVTLEALLRHLAARCRHTAVGAGHVLALQDTTEINFQSHAGRVEGLGTVGNGTDLGLFLHPVLAVAADTGHCLGLAGARAWLRRHQKSPQYKALPIEQKESYRWIEGAEIARTALSTARHITVVGDRESDIYEAFARIPGPGLDLLVRVGHNRALADGDRLCATVAALPVRLSVAVTVRPDNRTRAGRTARLEVRFGPVTLRRPQSRAPSDDPPQIPLWAVSAAEPPDPDVPDNQRIHWLLLTSHRVEDVETAQRVIDWYRQRWHIEQLFRTVKSQGLDVEASQVEDGQSLLKLAVMAVHVASRVLQMVNARDGTDPQPAERVFARDEITVMHRLQPRLEGNTAKQKNPHPPDTLAWATWIIARLGGWKGYRSERPPGPITLSRGYHRFTAIQEGYLLAQRESDLCKP